MNSWCAPPRPRPALDRPLTRARFFSLGEALYVLAFMGAHVAFMPFLMLLLPRRVAMIGGGEHLLSQLVLLGGVTASIANIIAGHASDSAMLRQGNRRRTIAAGLLALIVCYGFLAIADGPLSLGLGVVGFQIAVNLLFSPMGPLIADYIPDARKGRIAGFLNCGLPVATGVVSIVAWAAPFDGASGFAITAGLVLFSVLPLLVLWPFRPVASAVEEGGRIAVFPARNIVLAWGARCLLQLGATLLTSYLYPYVDSLLRAGHLVVALHTDAAVGWMSLWAGLAACGGAVISGHWSDMLADRRKLMVSAALLAALALTFLAAVPNWPGLVLAYALFHFALAAFFAVEAAFVAEMAASSARRGRLLGVMNLANTLPAILTASLALRASGHVAFDAAMPKILLACAGACICAACLCVAMVDRARPEAAR